MNNQIRASNSSYSLLCNYRFTDNTIELIKEDVKRFMHTKEKEDSYIEFIDWQKKDNEIAVLTMYASKDLLLPSKLDTIFQIDTPENAVSVDFTVTQAVFNGYAPVRSINKGHKHILILEFKSIVPDIFRILPFFDENSPLQTTIQLGFYNKTDSSKLHIGL